MSGGGGLQIRQGVVLLLSFAVSSALKITKTVRRAFTYVLSAVRILYRT